MPMFDFICTECGHEFEKITKVDAKTECPQCGAGRRNKYPHPQNQSSMAPVSTKPILKTSNGVSHQ